MPLISLDHVTTAFGHVPLLDDAGMMVEPGERIAVIGLQRHRQVDAAARAVR